MEGSQISAALENLSQIFTVHPEKARAKQATAIATLESGLKCRVVGPGGEEIKTDMPRAMGGDAASGSDGDVARSPRTKRISARISSNVDGQRSCGEARAGQ